MLPDRSISPELSLPGHRLGRFRQIAAHRLGLVHQFFGVGLHGQRHPCSAPSDRRIWVLDFLECLRPAAVVESIQQRHLRPYFRQGQQLRDLALLQGRNGLSKSGLAPISLTVWPAV